jgi:hypothetical protein
MVGYERDIAFQIKVMLIQFELYLIESRPDFEQLRTAIFFSFIHDFSPHKSITRFA